MKQVLWKKGMVLGAVVILILTGFTSVVGISSEESDLKKETSITDMSKKSIEIKQLLFQALKDIGTNPEVNSYFKSSKVKIELKNNMDSIQERHEVRKVFLKLLFKEPWIIFSIIRTKPTFSETFFDFAYIQGQKIINTIGKTELISMMKSVRLQNPQLTNELTNIISNNDELREEFYELSSMDCDCCIPESEYDSQFEWNFPMICSFLFPTVAFALLMFLFGYIMNALTGGEVWLLYLVPMLAFDSIGSTLNCWWYEYF